MINKLPLRPFYTHKLYQLKHSNAVYLSNRYSNMYIYGKKREIKVRFSFVL